MEASTAAAQCHYQAGRYSHAIAEFDQCEEAWEKQRCKCVASSADTNDDENNDDDEQRETHHADGVDADAGGIIMADDGDGPIIVIASKGRNRLTRPVRVELIALPPLARRADVAMCRFRSASSSQSSDVDSAKKVTENSSASATKVSPSANDKLISPLWEEAVESNRIYRQALKGAATSLVQSCNLALQQQSQTAAEEAMQQCKRKRDYRSIQKAIKSTALVMLMAGIAASHLYLHNTNENNNGASCYCWNVLVDAAISAADLMQTRKEWMAKITTYDCDVESDLETRRGEKKFTSLLEESLCILNETLFNSQNMNITRHSSKTKDDDERASIAMHSFRSALKVAALATGKLIIPKVADETMMEHTTAQEPSRKRQKAETWDGRGNSNRPRQHQNNKEEDGVWNTSYQYSSPMLHARDRLLDGLSFHVAAKKYSQKSTELITSKREICLKEAVEWENRAGVLYTKDGSGEIVDGADDGRAGYVWKIHTCLRGAELVNTVDHRRQRAEGVLQSLELLASSSSSQFACDLLGCVYAQRKDFSRAIEKFQLSLDCNPGQGDNSNSDEEIGAGVTERRTIVNMALCFLAMGEVHTPLELLLHLWLTISESQSMVTNTDTNDARAMAILLSYSRSEMECMSNASKKLELSTKIQLLWKLFHVSSLAQDWSTCLNAMEEMPDEQNESCVTQLNLARAFALLQCRRPSAAQEVLDELLSQSSSDQFSLVMAELYTADAFMLNDQNEDFDENASTPLDCTQRTMDVLDSMSKNIWEDVSIQELRVTTHNNHALALIMSGDSIGALRYLREAVKHSESSANVTLSWLLLPTYFNLSLLLLRDGHNDESAKSWLQARGYLSLWQTATRGDSTSLRKLKDIKVVAINCHGLLMAKRTMREGATWDQETIMEWVPPVVERGDVNEDSTRVGGLEASQIFALDVVLLRYAVASAEKKAKSSFRKSAGHVGY